MKLSRKSDYALRALVSLAARWQEPDQELVSVRDLAAANDVSRRFLEQIMLELKDKGWVSSVAGRDGGYRLALPPDQISMGAVVRHFDGWLAPIGCVSKHHYEPCSQEGQCRFRRIFLEIRNFTARLLEGTTLAALLNLPPVINQEVFTEELVGGAGI